MAGEQCSRLAPAAQHCQCIFYRYLREAHDRTTARWPAAPWMLARASAKRMHSQCDFNALAKIFVLTGVF